MVDVVRERLAECVGKHTYDSKGAAILAAKRARGAFQTYRCPYCHKWHNGHSTAKRFK